MKFLRQIKVRLMLWYMATIVILVAGISVFSYIQLHKYAGKTDDDALETEANEASIILQTTGMQGMKTEAELWSKRPLYYTLYDEKGGVILDTFGKDSLPFDKVKVKLGPKAAFDTKAIQGEEIRIITKALPTSNPEARYVLRLGLSIRPETRLVENLADVLAVFVPSILLIAIVVGWILARTSLKPMQRLSEEAARITDERLSERLPVRGVGDEIDQHAEVLNRMLAGLESSFTEIKTFAARASHELRTPLTALRLQIESALRAEPAEARATLESALVNLDRLASLVHRLLFLTRSKGEAPDLQLKPLDLSELVSAVCTDAALLAEQKSVKLRHAIAAGAPVMADAALLSQMVWNLIDNAIKFSPPGETIDVAVEKQAGSATLVVKDRGPGISAEDMPHLFEVFYRGQAGREAAGFGLGLNISRWICEIHHGTMNLANNPDRGATATVSLPLAGTH